MPIKANICVKFPLPVNTSLLLTGEDLRHPGLPDALHLVAGNAFLAKYDQSKKKSSPDKYGGDAGHEAKQALGQGEHHPGCVRCHRTKCPLLTSFFLSSSSPPLTFLQKECGFKSHKKS
jgi:hypothetical protein